MQVLKVILDGFSRTTVNLNQDNKINIDGKITYETTVVQDKNFGLIGAQKVVIQPEYKPAAEVVRKAFGLNSDYSTYVVNDLLIYFDLLDGKADKLIDLNAFKTFAEEVAKNPQRIKELTDYLYKRKGYYNSYPTEIFSFYRKEYWPEIKASILNDLDKALKKLGIK